MTERIAVVFYFQFNLDPEFHQDAVPADPAHPLDEENLVTYAFAGTVPTDMAQAIQEEIDQMDGWYGELLGDLEAHGVHDWGSSPDDRVLCLGGYSSYEVPPASILTLMEAWRAALAKASTAAGVFGPVVALPAGIDDSDYDIHAAAVAAGSVTP